MEPSGRWARAHRARAPRRRPRRGPPRSPNAMVTITARTSTRCGCASPIREVRRHGQFEQGRHHRADRSEQQGHETGESSAKRPKVARPPGPAPRHDRSGGDVWRAVSHGVPEPATTRMGPRGDRRSRPSRPRMPERPRRVSRETTRRWADAGRCVSRRDLDAKPPMQRRRWHPSTARPPDEVERAAMVELVPVRALRAGH